MPELYQELENWFKERPAWLQESARLLIKKTRILDEDISTFILLCQQEANGESVQVESIKREQLTFGESKEIIRIAEIKEIKGVNSLAPRSPLNLGDENLSIIYGGNGTGKSGYARTLKNICGAKNPGKLLGNIYEEDDIDIECKLQIDRNGKREDVEWKPEIGVVKNLSSVEIFDAECADVYATKENETAYEPYIMRLFSRIIGVCELVSTELDLKITALPSSKPLLPVEYNETEGGIWYSKLNSNTKESEIETHCSWSDALEKTLKDSIERLTATNPTELAQTARRIKKNIDNLILKINSISKLIDKVSCENIINQKSEAARKRKSVDKEAQLVFEDSSLNGVGQETWKAMWTAAKKYSTEVAYIEKEFPYLAEDALCLLCQQPLDTKAKERFKKFETFVKSSLESEAKLAEVNYQKSLNALPSIPSIEDIQNTLDACGIVDEQNRLKLAILFEEIRKRCEWLKEAEKIEDMPLIKIFEYKESLSKLSKLQEERAIKFDADAKGQNREKLQKESKKLQTQKWLSEQKEAIYNEISRLKTIVLLKNAKKLTNTQSLSTKKSSIAEVVLSAEYLTRFKEELNKLGAKHINVEIIKTRTSHGKVYHQLVITNMKKSANLQEVLSQGEYRIVSLAAFLADACGRTDSSPFIFDDPVSSLDQEYEEKLVERLVDLSKTRQVIVFTHRLSLLSMLTDVSTKSGISPVEICLRSEPWGNGEPSETSFFAKKPDRALNNLKDNRLAIAKKVYLEKGQQEYDCLAKGICSDFRILVESAIENILLDEVILRFRRSIVTKGKIEKLSKIKLNDCQILDNMMTKYSKYEHSQSSETPVELPKATEIEEDITKITDWIKEFKNRN